MNTLIEETIEPASIGERLKAARLKKKVTLEAAAQTTRIRSVYLEALENNRWEELPGEVYLYGFLKKYAQFLGLSPDGLAELYTEAKKSTLPDNKPPTPSVMEPPPPPSRQFSVRPSLAAGAVLTVLAAFMILPRQHAIARRPSHPPIPLSEHTLSATALRDVWMSVSSNNRHLFRGIIIAADIRSWKSRSSFQIEVRKAADVRVEVDGTPVDLTGDEGRRISVPAKP